MSHYIEQRKKHDDWLIGVALIPAILDNPNDYSTDYIESIVAGYETYSLPIGDDPPSNYLKLIDILNIRSP